MTTLAAPEDIAVPAPVYFRSNLDLQRVLLFNLLTYIAIAALFLLFHRTILTAAAFGLYLVAPMSLAWYVQQKPLLPAQNRTIMTMVFLVNYLIVSLLIGTGVLYMLTDLWNPDHFPRYSQGVPSLGYKVILLLSMQLKWAVIGFVLGTAASVVKMERRSIKG